MNYSRRRFLMHAAGAALALRAGATEPELSVLSRQPQFYHGWPTIARRKNGDLWVVCSGGRTAHVCPFGQVTASVSRDEGRTWSHERTLYDGPLDDRDAGVLETARGTLLVSTFTSLAYEPALAKAEADGSWPADRVAIWKATRDLLTPEQRKAGLGEWILRSTDDGRSWSAPIASIVNSPHGPTQLRDGRILYAGKQLWTGEKKIGVAESRDDGQTWQWLAEIPTRPGERAEKEYHELHAVEAADGTLVAQIRCHAKASPKETLQTESRDGGKTWSEPHGIGVWGLPAHLLALRDGRLLMSYGYRRQPFGNQARVSRDGGRTWGEPITISGDGRNGDLGYPSTVELGDGTLLTVWYENTGGERLACLRQARWNLPTA